MYRKTGNRLSKAIVSKRLSNNSVINYNRILFNRISPFELTLFDIIGGLKIEKARKHCVLQAFNFRRNHFCRDDKIRTCDPTPPRRVRYRAALHPESGKSIKKLFYYCNRAEAFYF